MIGRTGRVVKALDPEGLVQLGGEQWSAIIEAGAENIDVNARVIVTGIKGLRLTVRERVSDSASQRVGE